MLRCVSGTCGDGNNPRPPPPPPIAYVPPPPPPLPPVPPPLPPSTPTGRKIKINRESKQKENESVRPIISLDDILKVKLRKTGVRLLNIITVRLKLNLNLLIKCVYRRDRCLDCSVEALSR